MRSVFALILASVPACGGTYWVSAGGVASSWSACQSISALSGLAACSLAQANANAVAGDTVNIRGGSYNVNVGSGTGAIQPANSGTVTNRIIFQAYASEVPILTNANPHLGPSSRYGILLDGKSYVKVSGITFVDWDFWAFMVNGAGRNEIDHCEMYDTTGYFSLGGNVFGVFVGNSYSGSGGSPSTHNWIHHNKLHDLAFPANAQCGTPPFPCEGGDMIRIGSAVVGDNTSNNNTIEYNTLYHAGHTLTDQFTRYNVWRGNIAHNDGFKPDPTHVTGVATGGSTTSLVHSGVDFVALGVCVWPSPCNYPNGNLHIVHDLDAGNSFGRFQAVIQGITTTSTPNDTLTWVIGGTVGGYTNPNVSGTPDFSSGGHHYDISTRYSTYAASPSNSLYGHRVFELDSADRNLAGGAKDYFLFEGNRGGHSAPNPTNDGDEGMSLTAGGGILRYNDFYNNSASGFYFKNGAASANNVAYNNTVYLNGRYNGIQHPTTPVAKVGVRLPSSTTINVAIKNMLIYNNVDDIATGTIPAGLETANNWCNEVLRDVQAGQLEGTGGPSVRGIWRRMFSWLLPGRKRDQRDDVDLRLIYNCSASGDPSFVNPDVTHTNLGTDTLALTLPDLRLQATSKARDGGAALTTTTNTGTSSTNLTVNDARYFQDGTWGSEIARAGAGFGGTFQADWIAIGSVTNTAQITSVNLTTNTITLASNKTWASGQPVWLYKKSDGERVLFGSAPDYGAHEYDDGSGGGGPGPPIQGGVVTGGSLKSAGSTRRK